MIRSFLLGAGEVVVERCGSEGLMDEELRLGEKGDAAQI
jgi:hypothetical protein